MLILLQTLLLFIGLLFTGFLLIEGWLTKSVWAKDCSQGMLANISRVDTWLSKTHLNKDPDWYWGFMGFYAACVLFFLIMLIF